MSNIMEPMSLLDRSPEAEQVDFPSLMPSCFLNYGFLGEPMLPSPVIREGSPIELEEEPVTKLEAEPEVKVERDPEVIRVAANLVPVKPAAVKPPPVNSVPAKRVPVKQVPAKQTPAKQVPPKQVPPKQPVPAKRGPVKPAPAKAVPGKPAPTKAAAPRNPVKGGPSPSQPKKALVAVKGKPDFSKRYPQGRAHEYLLRSAMSQYQPKRVTNRYSGAVKPPTGPANRQTVQPRWTLKSASVFASREEERGAAARLIQGSFAADALRDSSFFQWGLRYMPLPSDPTANAYRTVIIDHLPLQVTLDQILARIRGGQIFSANLLDTRKIIQSWTAMIVFVKEAGAMAFLNRVNNEGFFIGFRQAKVRPVPTPTYALGADMERHINRLGRTRCVVVSSPRERLKKSVHNMLQKSPCSRHVEGFGLNDPPGKVTIQFFSVRMARLAFDLLTDHANFEDSTLEFGPDPCA